jgi:hypothetical protein
LLVIHSAIIAERIDAECHSVTTIASLMMAHVVHVVNMVDMALFVSVPR